jgi:hypothetical protein
MWEPMSPSAISHCSLTTDHCSLPRRYGACAIFTHPFVPAAVATHTAFVPPTFPASKDPALLAVYPVTDVLAFVSTCTRQPSRLTVSGSVALAAPTPTPITTANPTINFLIIRLPLFNC